MSWRLDKFIPSGSWLTEWLGCSIWLRISLKQARWDARNRGKKILL